MRILIKNMVCPRCKMSVEQLLETLSISFQSVHLGEAVLSDHTTGAQLELLNQELIKLGFEILDDQRKQLIEKIKGLLIQLIQEGEIEAHFSISKFLVSHLHKDYSHISKLFTEVEGITIEQFFILQKTEKVKEWLVYDEFAQSDIAYRLGYSSVQHLSNQFKKVTGMTPGQFKKIGLELRKSIDQLSQ